MSSALVLAARLALALVFAVAGAAKLADRKGTRSTVVAFGAPAWSAAALAIALPLAELTVAVLLVPASTALVGAIGALALLGLFTAAIGWNMARGRAPECHCFGQLRSTPAGWRTLARNLLLVGIATVALVGTTVAPPTSPTAGIMGLSGVEVVALALVVVAVGVVAIVTTAFVSLMRSYGLVLTRLDRLEEALASAGISVDHGLVMPEIGLAPGSPAPFFAATSIGDEQISTESLARSGKPTLLLFTSPHCGPCAALMPSVAEWQREQGDRLTIVVASSGSAGDVRDEAERYALELVLHDEDSRLSELFGTNGTPSAVLLTPEATIGSWVAAGSEWIEQLVEQALEGEDEGGLPVGAEAPTLELPSLTGERMSLASLEGKDTVVLFWNPDCSFCRSMHDDVLAWEASANGITPRLVVISSGDAASTRDEGFRSLVLLDDGFAAGEAFRANGTPMAVLVDAEGRIASPVVAGAEAVLALAGSH